MKTKKKNPGTSKKNGTKAFIIPCDLLADVRSMIETARTETARAINSAQAILYWDLGTRIKREILKGKRAAYGEEVVQTLSVQLEQEFGRGFSRSNLFNMVRFAESYPQRSIVYTLCRQLTWSHFRTLLYIDDGLKRQFYSEMCRVERWSVRALKARIDGMLYERTAIAKKPEKVIEAELKKLHTTDQLSSDLVFRDPYFLDFLQLRDSYSEKDIEAAIMREMEKFILEMGAGFSFVERQKRMTIDGEDYYLDLLFYNRYLNRLVAIDLKLGKFQAADKGQMELYLRWLERHEMQKHEKTPIGLILCAGKSEEHVELLELSRTGIRVASYMTKLPPRKVLEKTLHKAIQQARAVLDTRTIPENQT